jgi:hypothetical protein
MIYNHTFVTLFDSFKISKTHEIKSKNENYTRCRDISADENIYIQADYNTTFSASRCLRTWFTRSQE